MLVERDPEGAELRTDAQRVDVGDEGLRPRERGGQVAHLLLRLVAALGRSQLGNEPAVALSEVDCGIGGRLGCPKDEKSEEIIHAGGASADDVYHSDAAGE